MKKQVQFERWLKTTLEEKAEGIKISPDIWEQIKSNFPAKDGRFKDMPKESFVNGLFPFKSGWKKALAGALCSMLLIGLIGGFSAQARAWASSTLNAFSVIFQVEVVRTGDGYSITIVQPSEYKGAAPTHVKTEPIKDFAAVAVADAGATQTPMFATAAEAEVKVGFPVRLPDYLPEGYELVSIAADKWEKTGKGFVNAIYQIPRENLKTLELMITDEVGFIQSGFAVREMLIENKAAYLSEFPIVSAGIDSEDTKPVIRAGQMLWWKDNGVVYMLRDTSLLPLEELINIAESIIPDTQ